MTHADTDRRSRHASSVDHVWHVWINRRQTERRDAGEAWESDLYEWKSALAEAERIPIWLKRVREGALPSVHQQCSQSAPEPIVENKVMCALGVNIADCPILRSLYATFAEQAETKFYADVTVEDADVVAGKVCAWHIFRTQNRITGAHGGLDTSEGYVKDEGDRMYWQRVYDNLSAADGSSGVGFS